MRRNLALLILLILLAAPAALGQEEAHMKLLAVSGSKAPFTGTLADLYLSITPGSGRVFIDTFPLTKLDTQISTRFAKEVACATIEMDCSGYDFFYRIEAGSSIIAGPSAGAAIAALTAATLSGLPINASVAVTGTINSGGLIGPVAGLKEKTEAAAGSNLLSLVLIPSGKRMVAIGELAGNTTENQSIDLYLYGEELGIEVKEVAHLQDLILALTGERVGSEVSEIYIDEGYYEVMEALSNRLCGRHESLFSAIDMGVVQEKNLSSHIGQIGNLSEDAKKALKADNLYSAASFCFGANVQMRYLGLLSEFPGRVGLRSLINLTHRRIDALDASIQDQVLHTITDLQTSLIVKERLQEARAYLDVSSAQLDEAYSPEEELDVYYSLAFGIERLDSADAWSTFFDSGGKEFDLDTGRLQQSCLQKVSEAEERYQYLSLVLPLGLPTVREEITEAQKERTRGGYARCLFLASKAKARANVVLGSQGVEEDHLDQLLENKIRAVEQTVGREIEKGIFPILGYSYLEYGKSLAENDPYSALLYLEFSQELSNFDLYFPQKKAFVWPTFGRQEFLLFMIGVFSGMLVMNLMHNFHARGKRKKEGGK